MIAVTSLSPNHKNFDSQKIAIDSWIKAGYKVLSLNNKEEILKLKEFEDVEFVATNRTNERLFGRPYVLISAIIDHLKTIEDEDYFLIINSDIIIKDKGETTQYLKEVSDKCVVIINRCDFVDTMDSHQVYKLGFDGFFINKKWLSIFPQSILCLGQCFWDFWLPYQCTLNNVPIYNLKEAYIYHKIHKIQYSAEDWKSTGYIFQGETHRLDLGIKMGMDVGKMSNYVYKKIESSFI